MLDHLAHAFLAADAATTALMRSPLDDETLAALGLLHPQDFQRMSWHQRARLRALRLAELAEAEAEHRQRWPRTDVLGRPLPRHLQHLTRTRRKAV